MQIKLTAREMNKFVNLIAETKIFDWFGMDIMCEGDLIAATCVEMKHNGILENATFDVDSDLAELIMPVFIAACLEETD